MKKNAIFAIIFVLAALTACKNVDNPTDPSNNSKNPSFFFAPTTQTLSEDGLLCTFAIYKYKSYNEQIGNFQTFSGSDACFYNTSMDISVDAGTVNLNNTIVSKYFGIDSSRMTNDYIWAYGDVPYNSNFDGSTYSWNVSGSSFFQQLTTSINAPYYEVAFSNITPNQSLSLTQGFTVNWNNFNHPTDGAKLIITQGNNTSFTKESVDDGAIEISQTDLNNFTQGSATILLITGNMVIIPLQNDHYGYSVIYSYTEIPVNLQ